MGERHGLILVRVAGALVLVLFVAFQVINPKAPVGTNTPGFRDPVLAFELASTAEHVFGILGPAGAPVRDDTVRRMKLGTRLDFLFLLAYPALYVGIAAVLSARGAASRPVGMLLVGLALVMAVGDALENRELLRLADMLDPGAMGPVLRRLRIFTLVKWYALFAASVLAGMTVARLSGVWRWSAPCFVLGGLVGFASIVHLPAIEWSLVPIGLAWTLAWVAALRTRSPTAYARRRVSA